MYTHTPMVLQQMSQHSQHQSTARNQSTARIRVPSGLFGLAEQGLLFEHFFFLFHIFQAGWERLESTLVFDFDNQSAANFCVETIKYCSIPSVPSGLEEVETHPLYKMFRQAGNAENLFDFDAQSAAISCVDTINHCSIQSVPSRLEGVKTRP